MNYLGKLLDRIKDYIRDHRSGKSQNDENKSFADITDCLKEKSVESAPVFDYNSMEYVPDVCGSPDDAICGQLKKMQETTKQPGTEKLPSGIRLNGSYAYDVNDQTSAALEVNKKHMLSGQEIYVGKTQTATSLLTKMHDNVLGRTQNLTQQTR